MPEPTTVLNNGGIRGFAPEMRDTVNRYQSGSGPFMISDDWYYRLMGEVFGPVTQEQLRDQLAQGMVGDADEVRQGIDGFWMPASQALLLLSFGSAAVSESASRDELETLMDQFDFTATPTATGAAAQQTATTSSPTVTNAWFYQVLGQELGPVSFDELQMMAERGGIGPDDSVKLGGEGKWRSAGSIGRLRSAMPFQDSASTGHALRPQTPPIAVNVAPPITNVVEVEVPTEEAVTEHLAMQEQFPPVSEVAVNRAVAGTPAMVVSPAMTTVPQYVPLPDWAYTLWWSAYLGGQEYGPVELSQLQQWASLGQLTRPDFIRYLPNGQWQPAETLPGLFPVMVSVPVPAVEAPVPVGAIPELPEPVVASEAPRFDADVAFANTTPSTNVSATTVPAPGNGIPTPVAVAESSLPTPVIQPVVESQSAPVVEAKKPAATPVPEDVESKREAARVAERSQSAAVKPSQPLADIAKPTPVATPIAKPEIKPAATPTPVVFKPQVITPAPVPVKRASEPSGPSLGERFAVLKNPVAMGAIAVITFNLLWFLVLPAGIFEFNVREGQYYRVQLQILDEVQQLRQRGAADAEWLALQSKHAAGLKAQAEYLEPRSDSNTPHRQALLWNAKYRFVEVVGKSRTGVSEAEKEFHQNLDVAARHMNLNVPPPLPAVVVANTPPATPGNP